MLEVAICAGCLATNVKMHNMSSAGHLEAYQILTGIQHNEFNMDEMSQHLCWECNGLISKFNKFRLKCESAHKLLQHVYMQHGEITYKTVDKIDRMKHNLCSTYSTYITSTQANYYEIKSKSRKKTKYKNLTTKDTIQLNVKTIETNEKIENNEVKVEEDCEPIQEVEIKKEMDEEEVLNNELLIDYMEMEVPEMVTNDKIKKTTAKVRKKRTPKERPTYVRVRKTQKIFAKDFGMKEEILTQEQQHEVLQMRQFVAGFETAHYSCDMCYRSFSEAKAFSNHQLLHDLVSGTLVCDVCKIHYKTRLQLTKHIRAHHMYKYTCLACNAIFYNRSNAQKHFAWHKGVVYTCHVCGAIFQKKTSHQNHLRIKHASSHICAECGEPFVSGKGLRQHINLSHKSKELDIKSTESSGPYCAVCEVKFKTQEAWTRHILTSTKHQHERELCQHGCNICGKTFPDTESLTAHRVLHRRGKAGEHAGPFACEQCGELMASSRKYHAHFRRFHPDKTRTLYPAMRSPVICELCGRVFQDKVHLKLHSYSHTGERPYKCDLCSKSFKTSEVLRVHRRSHTKELPYKCDICGQGFSNSANMKRHRAVHTDAKPFKCETCGKTFKYNSTVKSHIEYVHMKRPWPKRDRTKRSKPETGFVMQQT